MKDGHEGFGKHCLRSGSRMSYCRSPTDRAFLQDTNEITFSDEDMEVGYLDRRRPLYLEASITKFPLRELWLTRALQKSHPT